MSWAASVFRRRKGSRSSDSTTALSASIARRIYLNSIVRDATRAAPRFSANTIDGRDNPLYTAPKKMILKTMFMIGEHQVVRGDDDAKVAGDIRGGCTAKT
jgi:hypothetical protein